MIVKADAQYCAALRSSPSAAGKSFLFNVISIKQWPIVSEKMAKTTSKRANSYA
jgi:biotin synthase-related radical SAM superfamily protein